MPRDEIWQRVDEALAAVELPYGRDHLTSALSGGELQRLALAGVLALRPDVLLLDEPTSMLDADHAESVRDAVLAVAGGRTLLVVEHRFEPWLDHVDRVVVHRPTGHSTFDGSVAAFLAGPRRSAGCGCRALPTPHPHRRPGRAGAP